MPPPVAAPAPAAVPSGARLRLTGDITLLPPIDVFDSLAVVKDAGLDVACLILDPWYNKGLGGERDDYAEFVTRLFEESAAIADHVFFWGFPEIVAPLTVFIPDSLQLTAWLTWFYKNSPSVIRGWRSSQMACLHLSREGARLYPEHFLNEAQLEKQRQGKLRYMPGPTSVIEEALLVGFCGRAEQVGHKAQKPEAVFRRIIDMTTAPGDLVYDPMCGSGTAAAAAVAGGRRAIISDHAPDYVAMAAERLSVMPLDWVR